MGVYIKGMEMPESCSVCPLKAEVEFDEICSQTGEYVCQYDRADDCPLVPVTKHGRLIDADVLKLSHCKECTLYPDKCLEKTGEGCDWGSIYHIEHCAPTIIEAEEGE